MAAPEPTIRDGIGTLPDQYVPRFQVYFAKATPFAPPGPSSGGELLDPTAAIAAEKKRLDGLVFKFSNQQGAAVPPSLSQLLPLAGPWGDKAGQYTDDILSVSLTDSIENNQLSQIQVEILNVYDFQRKTYRYTDIPANLPIGKTGTFPLLDYGDTLALRIGYGDALDWVFDGIVEKLEVDFPADGESRLSVTAVDRRQLLRNKKQLKQNTFDGSSEEQLIAQIARLVGLQVAADSSKQTKLSSASQRMRPTDQDALTFICDRVTKASLELQCFGKTLFVLPPADDHPSSALRYVYRRGLISFKPTFNGTGKPTKVRVISRNPVTQQRIQVEVDSSELVQMGLAPESSDGTPLDKVAKGGQGGERLEVVTNYLAHTEQEAKLYAVGILRRNMAETITATGNVVGDPRIRPRTLLQIEGVGRFDGIYYVVTATHRFGSNGYQTDFTARRDTALPDQGSSAAAKGAPS